jgi:hypothetical protein
MSLTAVAILSFLVCALTAPVPPAQQAGVVFDIGVVDSHTVSSAGSQRSAGVQRRYAERQLQAQPPIEVDVNGLFATPHGGWSGVRKMNASAGSASRVILQLAFPNTASSQFTKLVKAAVTQVGRTSDQPN